MTAKMTPLRWLAISCAAAALYVMYLLASSRDGIWNVAPQLNSVFLTALSILVVTPAMVAAVVPALVRALKKLVIDLLVPAIAAAVIREDQKLAAALAADIAALRAELGQHDGRLHTAIVQGQCTFAPLADRSATWQNEKTAEYGHLPPVTPIRAYASVPTGLAGGPADGAVNGSKAVANRNRRRRGGRRQARSVNRVVPSAESDPAQPADVSETWKAYLAGLADRDWNDGDAPDSVA